MSEPTQTCSVCGDSVTVVQTGRGYPPEIAKRKLAKRCQAAGHRPAITYRAGVAPDLMQRLRDSLDAARSGSSLGKPE